MTQFMGTIAGCVPLSLSQWGLCFAIGAGCVPFGALVKLLVPVPGTVLLLTGLLLANERVWPVIL